MRNAVELSQCSILSVGAFMQFPFSMSSSPKTGTLLVATLMVCTWLSACSSSSHRASDMQLGNSVSWTAVNASKSELPSGAFVLARVLPESKAFNLLGGAAQEQLQVLGFLPLTTQALF